MVFVPFKPKFSKGDRVVNKHKIQDLSPGNPGTYLKGHEFKVVQFLYEDFEEAYGGCYELVDNEKRVVFLEERDIKKIPGEEGEKKEEEKETVSEERKSVLKFPKRRS